MQHNVMTLFTRAGGAPRRGLEAGPLGRGAFHLPLGALAAGRPVPLPGNRAPPAPAATGGRRTTVTWPQVGGATGLAEHCRVTALPQDRRRLSYGPYFKIVKSGPQLKDVFTVAVRVLPRPHFPHFQRILPY